jgi:hypothetical protein
MSGASAFARPDLSSVTAKSYIESSLCGKTNSQAAKGVRRCAFNKACVGEIVGHFFCCKSSRSFSAVLEGNIGVQGVLFDCLHRRL